MQDEKPRPCRTFHENRIVIRRFGLLGIPETAVMSNQASKVAREIKVVYIAGYGRSGSTVLSIALGSHSDIFGGGEITTLARHVWERNEFCSCGKAVQQCEMWTPIVKQWQKSEASNLLARYGQLQSEVERLGHFSSVRTRSEYNLHTARLFEAISSVSGRDIIVDSSKSPARAFALARIPGINLHVIHLVRDGRGVAWSMAKPYKRDVKAGLQKDIASKPVLRTAARWTMVNLAAEWLCWQLPANRVTRVRYEDFTVDPRSALDQIGQAIGVDLRTVGAELAAGNVIKPEHQIAGNRLRMRDVITLAQDAAWRTDMPSGTQRLLRFTFAMILRRYGYHR